MKKSSIEQAFTFWCPISKAAERVVDPTTGEEQMVLGGIASTADEDSDGEFLDPKGFDIKPLINSGLVNWHHQAKGQPATIIGEPRFAEIRKEGLYIETLLYPSSKIAQDVWELAQTLEKDSKTRRLGYSIEGKVLKRKSDDPKDPGYKHISKAVITGVAITHMPKNPKTFANIIKGEIGEDDLEEAEETVTTETNESEGMDTKRGKALMKESVDKRIKRTTFGKAEVFERLFKDIPGIAIEKARQIYSLIDKIAHMEKKKTITEEDIQKAYEALGLEAPVAAEEVSKGDACGGSEEVLSKSDDEKGKEAETEEVEEKTEEVEEEETEKGCGGSSKKTLKKAKKAEDASEEETEETETEEEETEEEVKKGGENRFDRIEKAIAASHQLNSKSIRALGVLVKGIMSDLHEARSENAELHELVKGQSEEISELRGALEAFGSQTPGRKSVSAARVVERTFAKSNENDFEKGEEVEVKGISMSRQPNVVSEILDQATFAKGYDDEMSKACLSFEANHTLPANIIKRLKSEFNVEIVK